MLSLLTSNTIIAWIVFVFWQISSQSNKDRRWYDENRTQIPGACIPGYMFGILWFFLYGLIAASSIVFFANNENTPYYLAIFIILVVNILINKFWSVLFFDAGNTLGAIILSIILFLTSTAINILLGLTNTTTSWISFGLFLPYTLWLIYVIYLNYQWYKYRLPTKNRILVEARVPFRRNRTRLK